MLVSQQPVANSAPRPPRGNRDGAASHNGGPARSLVTPTALFARSRRRPHVIASEADA
ncbi:MAG: hypothetical protein AAGJ11_14835 [Bacteroidota bacterium]